MSGHRRHDLWIATICISLGICACNRVKDDVQTDSVSNNEPSQETAPVVNDTGNAVLGDTAVNQVAPTEIAQPEAVPNDTSANQVDVSVVKINSPCKVGGDLDGALCVCGEMKYAPESASQWACVGDILRCLASKGCDLDGKHYPKQAEVRKGTVYCEDKAAPDNPNGFECMNRCDSVNHENEALYNKCSNFYRWRDVRWVCKADQCDCHGIQIGKDKICHENGVLADNDGIFKTQEEMDTNNAVCGDIHYNEIPVDYKDEFICKNGKWTCTGELICTEGKWYCVEEGYEDAELCRKLSKDYDYHVPDTFDKDAPIVPCKTLGYESRYDMERAKEYDVWGGTTCNGYLDGYCRYGYNKNKKAETCDQWDFSKYGGDLSNKAYGEYGDFGLMHGNRWLEEDDETVCIHGNCPCGDGACPQYATCHDGQCFCGGNIGTNYGEFYCEIEVGDQETEWAIFYSHVLECHQKNGCHTKDGRHYVKGAAILYEDNLQYHIDVKEGELDLNVPHHGECLLPEKDCDRITSKNKDYIYCETRNGLPSQYNKEKKKCENVVQYERDSYEWCFEERYQNYDIWTDGPCDWDDKEEDNDFNSEKMYDVQKCTGGHRYCNGEGQTAQLVPKDYKGYICTGVDSIDGAKQTDSALAWVCKADGGCQCGKQNCQKDHACIDEKCVEAVLKKTPQRRPEMSNLYENQLDPTWGKPPKKEEKTTENEDNSVEAAENEDKQNDDTKTENKKETPKCDEGLSYDEFLKKCIYNLPEEKQSELKDVPEYALGPVRRCVQGKYEKDTCSCGDKVIQNLVTNDCAIVNGKGYEICALSTGCACGDQICPNTTACIEGKCIDPLTDKPIEEVGNMASAACKDGNCRCGGQVCQTGEFCYHSHCLKNFYASLLDGKRRTFNPVIVFDYINDDYNEGARGEFNFSDYLYLKAEAPDGYIVYPEPVCTYDYRDEQCGDEDRFCIVTGGPNGDECLNASWDNGENRCDLPEGCACGNAVCQWGGICDKGVCKYDGFYMNYWFPDEENRPTVDPNGNGVCAGMQLTPKWGADYKKTYECTDMGWRGKHYDGCDCGDAHCITTSYCIKPGMCTDPQQ